MHLIERGGVCQYVHHFPAGARLTPGAHEMLLLVLPSSAKTNKHILLPWPQAGQ